MTDIFIFAIYYKEEIAFEPVFLLQFVQWHRRHIIGIDLEILKEMSMCCESSTYRYIQNGLNVIMRVKVYG